MTLHQKDGLTFQTSNRAVRAVREIEKDGQQVPYEFMYQVASGPCVVLTFQNLWSFLHGSLPNMEIPLITEGISGENFVEMFSLVHGGEPKDEDIVVVSAADSRGHEIERARNLVGQLDTSAEGTMVCGMLGHCTAVQRYKELYVKIDPNNEQGLEVFRRDQLVEDIRSRFVAGAGRPQEDSDIFFFPHSV